MATKKPIGDEVKDDLNDLELLITGEQKIKTRKKVEDLKRFVSISVVDFNQSFEKIIQSYKLKKDLRSHANAILYIRVKLPILRELFKRSATSTLFKS